MNDRLAAALSDRYTIERELGQGGMATVYLAHDLKHDRKVAVKVLRPELAAVIGADRFLAEIKTTANLQHPHILALFDSGQVDGTVFYVMPFVEGESLRDRLAREKQLPIDDALRIAREVADALQYAHEHGVIHRDIKPENILLHGGHALVADFGIALAASKTGGSRMTETGMSLGTPQYMSPEQAMGERDLDARTDVYALGCVTYEMLVGDPPFTASTAQGIVAKVMTEKPASIVARRDRVPEQIEDAVLTALQKLPADRFASAAAFSAALSGAHTTAPQRRARAARPHQIVRVLPWLIAGAAAVAAVILYTNPARAGLAPPATFAIEPPPGSSAKQAFGDAAVSPDGQTIAFVSIDGGVTELFLRHLGDLTSHAIPGSRGVGVSNPTFSPDGKWIAFAADGKWQRVPVEGGRLEIIGDAVSVVSGTSWTGRDELLYSQGIIGQGLMLLPGNGKGVAREFTKSTGNAHALPLALPDGDNVAFVVWGPGFTEDDSLAVGSIRTGKWTTLGIIAIQPVGFVDGRLVYVTADGSVMAVQLDVNGQRTVGTPIRIADGVKPIGLGGGLASLSSGGGTMVFQAGSSRSRLALVDASGPHPVTDEQSDYSNPRFSPNGKRVAVAIIDQRADVTASDIWILDDLMQSPRRLTSSGDFWGPVWMPDGKRVLYRTLYSKKPAIMVQPVDGSAPATTLFQAPDDNYIMDVSVTPDGLGVVYCAQDPVGASAALMYLALSSGAKPDTLVFRKGVLSCQGRVSPDGRWVAYTTAENGSEGKVFVQGFRTPGGVLQVSLEAATDPKWIAPNVLTYINEAGTMTRATLRLGSGNLSVASRQPLFPDVRVSGLTNDFSSVYDFASDGRLLMVKLTDERTRLVVTTNWVTWLANRIAAAAR